MNAPPAHRSDTVGHEDTMATLKEADSIDLGAYFERVHWRGQATPDHATLCGLLAAHMTHIPFENFDVLLGRPVALDPEALQRKLIRARRGGYTSGLNS